MSHFCLCDAWNGDEGLNYVEYRKVQLVGDRHFGSEMTHLASVVIEQPAVNYFQLTYNRGHLQAK